MPRIAGVDLPKDKRVEIALTYIYGIGRTSAQKILDQAGVERNKKADELTESEVVQIRGIIDEELEAVWAGDKDAQTALDSAAERGNALLRRFEQASR